MQSIPPPNRDPERIACIGESQGYTGLHVHFGRYFDHAQEKPTRQLTTAYTPTAEELAILNAGGCVVISLLHVQNHPPIMVGAEAV